MLLCSSIVYGIHFYFFHGGYFGFDDIEYCRLADSMLKGDFMHESLYAHRYISFLPLALSYWIFGVNDFANFFIGFLALATTVYILMDVLKGLEVSLRWLGAAFLVFAPMYFMYVEKPMPDIFVALGFMICFSSYLSQKYELGIIRQPSLCFVIGVIIIFFAKETFLIFYPYFVVLLLIDIISKDNKIFWKQVVNGLSVFIVLYLLYSYVFLGDPIARIHHIFAGQYISACSYDLQPFSVTLTRIGYQLWLELARDLYLLPLCFVPSLWNSQDRKVKFVARSYVSLLLLANFMSISYTSYVPLCPDPRHHIYVLPIGALVMTFGISNIAKVSSQQLFLILAILAFLLFISVNNNFESTWWLYLPLMIALVVGNKQTNNRTYNQFMIFLVLCGLVSVFWQNCIYNKKVNYYDQKRLNDFVINEIPEFKYVITDRVNHDYGLLHSRFDTSLVKFVDYKALDTFDFKANIPKYLITNGMTNYLSNSSWESLPKVVQTAHEKLPKVYENESGAVYRVE